MVWPFKKKVQEEQKIQKEKEQEVKLEYAPVSTIGVLDGLDNPWRIKIHDKIKGKPVFAVEVYSLKNSYWQSINSISEEVIGVKTDEFNRIMKEKFNARKDYYSTTFNSIEDAQRVIDELSPVYDNFHVPRAIADRLTCYIDGGYQSYIFDYAKKILGPDYRVDVEEEE